MNCPEQSVVHCKETGGWPKRNLGWKMGLTRACLPAVGEAEQCSMVVQE